MGFLSSTAWTKQKQPLTLVPECGKCGLYLKCNSPKMAIDGLGRRKTLIIGEGPGFNEDQRGKPFVGNAGAELMRILHNLGVNLRRDCWITNAIICRATDEQGNNRPPTVNEINHCQANVIRAIDELKPEIIIPLGLPATRSVLSYAWKDDGEQFDNMARWAGWQIPCQKLNTWICPTYHPSFLLQIKEKNRAAELIVTEHLRKAFTCQGRPYKQVPDYTKQVRIELDHCKAAGDICFMMAFGRPMAFDFENSPLKPDASDSVVLCCAVSDGRTAIAFPWYGAVITAMKTLVQSNVPKIASNMQHEERWCWRHLGCGVRNWWWDTMLGAHWSSSRHGICGLKFQSFVLLGAPDYSSHLDTLIRGTGEGSYSHNRLKEVPLPELLSYCATDALLEVMVALKQREQLDGV